MVSDHRVIAIISNALGRTCGRQRPGGLRRLMGCRLAGCRRACTPIQAVVASLRPCNGILPGCGRHRAGRLEPADAASTRRSWLIFGVKGLFPPKPPFISSLFRRGGPCPRAGRRSAFRPPCGHSLAGACVAGVGPRAATDRSRRRLGPSSPPPPARCGILPRRVPRLPARRPSARASVAVRSGSHPGKPARPASFFH